MFLIVYIVKIHTTPRFSFRPLLHTLTLPRETTSWSGPTSGTPPEADTLITVVYPVAGGKSWLKMLSRHALISGPDRTTNECVMVEGPP